MSYFIDLLPHAAEQLQAIPLPQRRYVMEAIQSTLSLNPIDHTEATGRAYPRTRAFETVQRTDDGRYRFTVEVAVDAIQNVVVIATVTCVEQDESTDFYP